MPRCPPDTWPCVGSHVCPLPPACRRGVMAYRSSEAILYSIFSMVPCYFAPHPFPLHLLHGDDDDHDDDHDDEDASERKQFPPQTTLSAPREMDILERLGLVSPTAAAAAAGENNINTNATAATTAATVSHFVHIPKTGGTSVREMMPLEYRERFPWGDGYTNLSCGIRKASTFHMTLVELRRCGIRPAKEPGLVLCVVRDIVSRFRSEVHWQQWARFQNYTGHAAVDKVKDWCERSSPLLIHDHYAHCRPQSRYLYDEDGNDLCDILIANPSKHEKLLTTILPGTEVPHHNSFLKHRPNFTQADLEWIKDFYREDYNDIRLQLALKGVVVTRRRPSTPRPSSPSSSSSSSSSSSLSD